MSEVTVSGNTYEEALAEGLRQLGVTAQAVDVEVMTQAHEDTLPGAEPLPGVTLHIRVQVDVLVGQAKAHLKRILELAGVQAHIEVLHRPRGVVLNILAGDDGALIIGKNGQNLDALQYLVSRMAMRGGREILPVIVDSEGYKEKRISKLEQLARRAAKSALRQQKDMALKPMSPAERRIIHLTLKEMRGVHTISRGEEGERYVVITPVGRETARNSRMRPGHAAPNRRGAGYQAEGSGQGYDPDEERVAELFEDDSPTSEEEEEV